MTLTAVGIIISMFFYVMWNRLDAIIKQLDKVIEQLNQNHRAVEGAAWPPYVQAPAARPNLKGQEPNQ